jgi:protein gp37
MNDISKTIGWAKWSFNPIVGCANNCQEFQCYAEAMNRRFKWIDQWNRPEFFEKRLQEPYKKKKGAKIFVGSMSDIFSEGVHQNWIYEILKVVNENPQHLFMFLSKRPMKYKNYQWPGNCMLGTTITSNKDFDRVQWLIRSTSHTLCPLFVSLEPILGPVDRFDFNNYYSSYSLDLLIIGAETGPGARIPDRDWLKTINHPNIYYKHNILKHFPDLINK